MRADDVFNRHSGYVKLVQNDKVILWQPFNSIRKRKKIFCDLTKTVETLKLENAYIQFSHYNIFTPKKIVPKKSPVIQKKVKVKRTRNRRASFNSYF